MTDGYLAKNRGFVESLAGHDLVLMGAAGVALDGSNPTPVTTGLSSIIASGVELEGASAPALSTSVLTHTRSGGTLSVYAWKPTGAGDTTLIASTGTETFSWWAIGRK